MKGEKRTFSWRKSRQVSSLGQYVIAVSPEENSEEKTHLVVGGREKGASHSNSSRRRFQFPPDRSEEEGPITSPPFATEVFFLLPRQQIRPLRAEGRGGRRKDVYATLFSPPTHEYSFCHLPDCSAGCDILTFFPGRKWSEQLGIVRMREDLGIIKSKKKPKRTHFHHFIPLSTLYDIVFFKSTKNVVLLYVYPTTFGSTTSTPENRGPDRCRFEQKALASLKEPKSYPGYLGQNSLKPSERGLGNAPNVALYGP